MSKNVQQEVEKLRANIEHVRDEIAWLSDAPIPRDELKARAAEGCEAMAARFEARRHLGTLANPGGGRRDVLDMFTLATTVVVMGELDTRPVHIDGIGPMLAWAMGDSLIQRLHAEIDRLDYRPGPPLAERPARLAALKGELRTLEQREEALICQAEESDMVIPRRTDADPAVVLGYDPNGEMSGESKCPPGRALPGGVVQDASAPAATIVGAAAPPAIIGS